jgi:valyl-tRNA synthetase
MPFVTEALWQKLKEATAGQWSIASFDYPALMLAPYPRADEFALSADEDELKGMALVQQAIHAIRNARAEYGVEPGKRIMAHISAGRYLDAFLAMRAGMELLARIAPEAEITAQTTYEGPAVTLALGEVVVYLPLAGLVDLEAERRRLSESLADLEAQIARSERLLASDFSRRAPPEVVDKEREKLDTLKLKRDQVSERLKAL